MKHYFWSTCLVTCVLWGESIPAMAGPLNNAAKSGDFEEVGRLLDGGADVNERGLATPLYYAIQNGHTETVRLLIDRGADVNIASVWGTPIHEAAKRGNAEVIALLLKSGADHAVRTSKGMTPLHSAAMGGSVEATQHLIDYGADLNALTNLDEPPIHYARWKGHEAVAQLLMKSGWTPPKVPPISSFLASADLKQGKLTAGGCTGGCHTLEKGKNGFGPSLWNVVGRPKGSISNFVYSSVFASLKGAWTYEELNAYLAHPSQIIPGTQMGDFRGIADIQERANLIAYLRTLSDNPVPLP